METICFILQQNFGIELWKYLSIATIQNLALVNKTLSKICRSYLVVHFYHSEKCTNPSLEKLICHTEQHARKLQNYNNLTHLRFSSSPGYISALPKTLKYLYVTYTRQKTNIFDILSEGLSELVLYNCYCGQPFDLKCLPKSLEKLNLDISAGFNQQMEGLPPNLKSLNISSSSFTHNLDGILPSTLEELSLFKYHGTLDNFPKGLKSLSINILCTPTIDIRYMYRLEKLAILDRVSIYVGNKLPESLKFLHLGTLYNYPLYDQQLPKNLSHLIIASTFNNTMVLRNLDKLKILEIDHDVIGQFSQPIELDTLPKNLESLTMRCEYNLPIKPYVLPSTLKYLDISGSFNQPFEKGSLPNNLKTLKFRCNFNHPLELDVLPKSLESLYLGKRFDCPTKHFDQLPNLRECYIANPNYSHDIPTKIRNLYQNIIFNC